MRKPSLVIPNISRRTKRRGMMLSAAVGLLTLGVGWARSPHPVQYPVVVATQFLPAGTLVTARDVALTTLPAPLSGTIPTLSVVVGHQLSATVVAHQPVMAADLHAVPLVDGLAPGEVGVMLPVSLASSDNVRPGDRVTIIWLGTSNTATVSSRSTSTKSLAAGSTLAVGLRVLAVLNSNGGPVTSYSTGGINATTPATVEVAVPNGSAGILALAAHSGRFWLTLDPWATHTGTASFTMGNVGSTLAPTPTHPTISSSPRLSSSSQTPQPTSSKPPSSQAKP